MANYKSTNRPLKKEKTGRMCETSVLLGLSLDDFDFGDLEVQPKLKDWVFSKMKTLLKAADPHAKFHASIVAVDGGYEVDLTMGISNPLGVH